MDGTHPRAYEALAGGGDAPYLVKNGSRRPAAATHVIAGVEAGGLQRVTP